MPRSDRYRWMLFGAGGLVGSHLRSALTGHDVIATAHRTPIAGAVTVDLRDRAATARAVAEADPDVVILAAADAYVERCEREPAATRRVNVDPARTISEAAPRAVLVVFSSEYVFDGLGGSYREDDPVSPINEYGRQKVDLESIARQHRAHLVCRVSGVYGWNPSRTSFVAQLVDALRAAQRFTVAADQLITPTPALDLGQAVVELVIAGARGTFHVAGPEILARVEFARRTASAFGLDASGIDAVPTDQMRLAAPRPRRAGLRTQKLVGFLGRGLRGSQEGLAEMHASEPR